MVPGLLLRQARERLGLTFRDVERASYQLASVRGRSDFIIHISRLAAIENQGIVPGLHKVYSLAAIYHLNPVEILKWYDVPLERNFADGAEIIPPKTHLAAAPQALRIPLRFDPAFNPQRTELLSRMVEAWNHFEGVLFERNGRYLYGYVGLDDHMMEPMIPAGTLVLVDPSRRQVKPCGWRNEFERPIYFLELRDGYRCGWCIQESKTLILQPHPLSTCTPKIYRYPDDAEVIGQVIELVMRLDGR
jgi:transcriptional regulator with XRE-family HTH domain